LHKCRYLWEETQQKNCESCGVPCGKIWKEIIPSGLDERLENFRGREIRGNKQGQIDEKKTFI